MQTNNNSNSTSQEGAPESTSETPAAPAAEPKSELQTRIEAAKADPAKSSDLLDDLYAELKKTRQEAGGNRTKYQQLKIEYEQLKKADDDRKLAELSELERANTERDTFKTQLEQERQERHKLEAKLAFTAAGTTDLDSVQALWLATPEADRAKTTPEEWVKGLKESKAHLFAAPAAPPSAPNPRTGAPGVPAERPAGGIAHPQNRLESAKLLESIKQQYAR